MQVDLDGVMSMFAKARGSDSRVRFEYPMFPHGKSPVVAAGAEQSSGRLRVGVLHQQIDVGHGPLAGSIEADFVERRALQRHDGDTVANGSSADVRQQASDTLVSQ